MFKTNIKIFELKMKYNGSKSTFYNPHQYIDTVVVGYCMKVYESERSPICIHSFGSDSDKGQ